MCLSAIPKCHHTAILISPTALQPPSLPVRLDTADCGVRCSPVSEKKRLEVLLEEDIE